MTDFTHTEKAIEKYDRETTRLDAKLNKASTQAEQDEILRQIEELEESVGIAFGEDTKAFNNPETCRKLIRAGPKVPPPGSELSFARRMVQKFKEKKRESGTG